MTSLSRREVLCNSGLAALMPLAGTLVASTVQAQTPNSQTAIPTVPTKAPKYSKDLDRWMQGRISDLAGTILSGKGNSSHWSQISSAIRQYAHHLEDTGIDQASQYFAAVLEQSSREPSGTDLSGSPAIDRTFNHLSSAGAGISRDDIAQRLRFTPAHFQSAAKTMREKGYSWHFHKMADAFHSVSKTLKAREIQQSGISASDLLPANLQANASVQPGSVVPAIYHPSHAPHLQRVSGKLCSIFKKLASLLGLSAETVADLCDALTDVGILSAAAGVTVKVACGGAVILSIVATDGIAAVIASPLEEIVCDALSLEAGLTAAAICAALTCALNC